MKGRFITMFLVLVSAVSCLFENDMAYPKVDSDILVFEVEGQKSVTIDKDTRSVHFVLEETADISNLKVEEISLSENAVIEGGLPVYIDLSDTLCLNVKVYQDEIWKVSATQPISRFIEVSNQIGQAEMDPVKCEAVVYVSELQELAAVEFLNAKFAPEGSVIRSTTGQKGDGSLETQPCEFPMLLDCVHRRTFLVDYNGPVKEWVGLQEWTVKVLKKTLSQQVTEVVPWCYRAEVNGISSGTGTAVFEYRKVSEEEWKTFSDVVVSNAVMVADITGLEAATDYLVRVNEDGACSPEYAFRTDEPEELYNMNFDDWSDVMKLDKVVWYPYAAGANPTVWDSANPGAAQFIGSSTSPEDIFVVEGRAARLESAYAVIAFAAGNIYTGKFGRINGVGAELDWGVPFSGRPAALKGYYCYAPPPIDNAKPPHTDKMGQMDRCQITVFLTDWDAPFVVNTTAGQFVDVENDPSIIAFARLETDENSGGQYCEFTLPLEYRDKTRTPKYVVIACAASYLGDYFTGGKGSTLYVDEFEFIYE